MIKIIKKLSIAMLTAAYYLQLLEQAHMQLLKIIKKFNIIKNTNPLSKK